MAATTESAIKAHLESLGSGVPFFRDGPRPGQAEPYGLIESQDITINSAASGDFGDPDAEITVIEIVTVDLIQRARTKVSARLAKNSERYGLAETIAVALHGCQLPDSPVPVTAVRVRGIDRFPIADNRVRHSITVEVHRPLSRAEVIPA
ncbi:hypothetical protein FCH28_09745 [Streptomyces piniterrae]|uniref:DUF3168 domain-containing protein n=1 Tax=Streptomyces piniterrae TaxID=2571125 RepID=A0A4U0NP18_9ACTN|nr:hypothetical protein [Streptomyces piniterrae]TJZ55612.1 hypothetical protein FCH28_09745 [Streptomyces piniterrae]